MRTALALFALTLVVGCFEPVDTTTCAGPEDCFDGESCRDGLCISAGCGNGVCETGEMNCPADCGDPCDGRCTAGDACAADCVPCDDDRVCDQGESNASCADCSPDPPGDTLVVGNFSNQRVDVQLEEQTVLVGLEPGAVSGRIAHGGVPLSVDFLASDGSGELAQVRSPSSTYSAVFLLQDPGGISATEFSDGAGTGDNRAGVAFLIAGGTIDPMDVFVDGVAVGQQLQFGQRSLWYPAEAGNVQVRARARNGQETEVPLRLQARELWYVVVHERDGALVLTPGLAGQQ